MNKDVIYIDVDDDVTAIIGKIKKAKEKVVALVPPKRSGALQSAVNLRLLDRMARAEKKQLVLITHNPALVALAASAKIPVAKNLQTKPEIAEVAALVVDDGDDIIDGSELPVGDHANTVKVKQGVPVITPSSLRSDDIDATDLTIDDERVAGPVASSVVSKSGLAKSANKTKKTKIPNFNSFRKKLFIGIASGVALIALLVWMFVFAPAATVVVTARTTPSPVSSSVTLGGTAATNFEKGIVSSVSQQEVKSETVEFVATGTSLVGNKATGTMSIRNCDGDGFTIPAGTIFTASNGLTFKSDSAISVSELSGSASMCRNTGTGAGTGSGSVTATEVGETYNVSSRSYTISGVSGDIYATGSTMSGGSSREVKVVSAEDVERAQGQLVGTSSDAQKAALKKKFTNGEVVIDSSFTVERGAVVSTPAIGAEAPNGKATLTLPTTYSMQAVPKNDLDTYLKAKLESDIDDKQKIYSTGAASATISNYRKEGNSMLATINATGRVGPVLDENAIKEEVKGKRYGEVQQSLESMDGIQSVDVKFSYFWVRTVPNNTDKVTVEFKVQNE